jgi:hypothetical protein
LTEIFPKAQVRSSKQKKIEKKDEELSEELSDLQKMLEQSDEELSEELNNLQKLLEESDEEQEQEINESLSKSGKEEKTPIPNKEEDILSSCLKTLNINFTSSLQQTLQIIQDNLSRKMENKFIFTPEKILELNNRSILCPQISFRSIFQKYFVPVLPFIDSYFKVSSNEINKFKNANQVQPAYIVPGYISVQKEFDTPIFVKISFKGNRYKPSLGDLEYEAYKNIIPYIFHNNYTPHLIMSFFSFIQGLGRQVIAYNDTNINNNNRNIIDKDKTLQNVLTNMKKLFIFKSISPEYTDQTLLKWINRQYDSQNLFNSDTNQLKISLSITISEYLVGQRFDQWIIEKLFTNMSINNYEQIFKDLYVIMFQIIWTIGVFNQLKIRHNDLKLDNLSINNSTTIDQYIYYKSKKNTFAIPTTPGNNNNSKQRDFTTVKIYDFDRSASIYDFQSQIPIKFNPPKDYENIDLIGQGINSKFNKIYDLFMFISLVQHYVQSGFLGMFIQSFGLEKKTFTPEETLQIIKFKEQLYSFQDTRSLINNITDQSKQKILLEFSIQYEKFLQLLNQIFNNKYAFLKQNTVRIFKEESDQTNFIRYLYGLQRRKIDNNMPVLDLKIPLFVGRLNISNKEDQKKFDNYVADIEDILRFVGEKAKIYRENQITSEPIISNIYTLPNPLPD